MYLCKYVYIYIRIYISICNNTELPSETMLQSKICVQSNTIGCYLLLTNDSPGQGGGQNTDNFSGTTGSDQNLILIFRHVEKLPWFRKKNYLKNKKHL